MTNLVSKMAHFWEIYWKLQFWPPINNFWTRNGINFKLWSLVTCYKIIRLTQKNPPFWSWRHCDVIRSFFWILGVFGDRYAQIEGRWAFQWAFKLKSIQFSFKIKRQNKFIIYRTKVMANANLLMIFANFGHHILKKCWRQQNGYLYDKKNVYILKVQMFFYISAKFHVI